MMMMKVPFEERAKVIIMWDEIMSKWNVLFNAIKQKDFKDCCEAVAILDTLRTKYDFLCPAVVDAVETLVVPYVHNLKQAMIPDFELVQHRLRVLQYVYALAVTRFCAVAKKLLKDYQSKSKILNTQIYAPLSSRVRRIRNEAAHGGMPSMETLQMVFRECWSWLEKLILPKSELSILSPTGNSDLENDLAQFVDAYKCLQFQALTNPTHTNNDYMHVVLGKIASICVREWDRLFKYMLDRNRFFSGCEKDSLNPTLFWKPLLTLLKEANRIVPFVEAVFRKVDLYNKKETTKKYGENLFNWLTSFVIDEECPEEVCRKYIFGCHSATTVTADQNIIERVAGKCGMTNHLSQRRCRPPLLSILPLASTNGEHAGARRIRTASPSINENTPPPNKRRKENSDDSDDDIMLVELDENGNEVIILE